MSKTFWDRKSVSRMRGIDRDSHAQIRSVIKKTHEELRFEAKYGIELPAKARNQPETKAVLACEGAISAFAQNPCLETLEGIYELREALPFISIAAYERLMASKFLDVIDQIFTHEPDSVNRILELVTCSFSNTSPFNSAYRSKELGYVLLERLNNLDIGKESQIAALNCLNRMCAIGTNEMLDQINDKRLFTTLIRIATSTFESDVLNLALATLSMAVSFPNIDCIPAIQTLSQRLLLTDLEEEQMCAAIKLFNSVIIRVGHQLGYYKQKSLLKRILGLIHASQGLIRTSLLKTLTLLTRDVLIIDLLLQLGMLDLLIEVAKSGTDHAIVLNIASNVASATVADCELVCEKGFVELAAAAFGAGCLEDKLNACYLVSNIMWKGSFREIQHVANPAFVGFLLEFLECDDFSLVQVVLDGFEAGLRSERECGATALHEILVQEDVASILTDLADSECTVVAQVASLILKELGVSSEQE